MERETEREERAAEGREYQTELDPPDPLPVDYGHRLVCDMSCAELIDLHNAKEAARRLAFWTAEATRDLARERHSQNL
jgi:hypothetical protein